MPVHPQQTTTLPRTGIDPRRPKYPISVERILDHRGFKFTADNVAMLLKAQVKP